MVLRKKRSFTLIEIIVCIGIMVLTTGIAVAVFRGESPAQRVDRATMQFESFCARVRYQAMETGRDRIVSFHPEKKLFFMSSPDSAAETDAEATDDGVRRTPIEWTLPEKFELSNALWSEMELADDGSLPLFRFFPDGAASGCRVFEMHLGGLVRKFEVSPLTGTLIVESEEE